MYWLPRFALVTLVLCTVEWQTARSADEGAAKTGFVDKVYKNADGTESKYVVFVPHDYKGDKEYPIILFLHGAGERGNDGQKQTKVGLGAAIRKKEKSFPFIAVLPQCETGKNWTATGPDAKRAVAMLDETTKAYKVDRKKTYLTGLSLGGYGTWSLAIAMPERWAAIAPVCGGGDPKAVAKIKDLPCWCFHGDADSVVKVEKSREMIKALKDAGGSPKYTEYPGVNHNSWDNAYATAELYEWFLKHTLGTSDSQPKIGNVVLKKTNVEKEVSVESINAQAGVVSEFKRSRTITREISYTTKIGVSAELEVKLGAGLLAVKGELTAKIKGSIEKAMGEKLSASETREQTIRIDGDKLPNAKIVWIDIYKTGTVEVIQDGKTYLVPFEFPIGTRLEVKKQ